MGTAKQLTNKYFPGLGDQHVVGLTNVGVSTIDVTLAVNTDPSDADLIAAPPNVDANIGGPVVHSLGAEPSLVFATPNGVQGEARIDRGIVPELVTADNSAVYLRPVGFSGGAAALQYRVIAIR